MFDWGYFCSILGVLLYNADTNTITKIYDEGYYWRYFKVVGDRCLITGSGSGILVYNAGDNSCKKIYDNGSNAVYFVEIDDKCLIGASSGSIGILRYSTIDDSCVSVYTGGYGWCSDYVVVGSKVLIGSSAYNMGLLSYDSQTDVVEKTKITAGYNWKYNKQITSTKWLISGTGNSNQGIVLFNSETGSLTKLTNLGKGYDVYVSDVNNNYIISSSSKTKNSYTLYYTEATDSITVKKYYLGEI